jgi:hypothetical protein
MKRWVAVGIVGMLLGATLATAADGRLAGEWLTAKGATLRCDDTSCTMAKPAREKSGDKAIGTVVLKDYKADKNNLGSAMLISPLRDDKYNPVETKLVGDALTLTIHVRDRSTSVTWSRIKGGPDTKSPVKPTK